MEESIDLGNYKNISNNVKSKDYGAIPPFSEKEAQLLAEKLLISKSHREALQVLIAWLGRGECNESNSTLFFNLIKLSFDYLRGLLKEHKECLVEVEEAKNNLANQKFMYDRNKIENAFKAIEKQDIWESLTPIQRNNIQVSKKDFLDLGQNVFMDFKSNAVEEEESTDLKNDSYKLNKFILTESINNLTSEVEEARKESKFMEARCKELKNEVIKLKSELEEHQMSGKQENPVEAAFEYNPDYAHQNEHILCSISILLFEHQSGLNLDAIYSHLNMTSLTANASEIEFVLRRFPRLFKEIGFGQERK